MAEAKLRHLSHDRRLAAIMFTDIVGYTKMMGEDEEKALSTLRINRETHKKLIYQFGGQFLKEMGDGILASFENSSDAVICAAAIQKASRESKIDLRIGIHMGEVIFENNDVFGDGVNIASRIQPLAEPGQILISETVQNNVQNKPGITTHLIGEKDLKNVAKAKIIYVVDVQDDFLTPGVRSTRKVTFSKLTVAVIVLLITAIGFGGYWYGSNSRDAPEEYPVIRYDIDLAGRLGRTGRHSFKFSPDGKYICYVSGRQLFLKALDDVGNGLPITGAMDPRHPAFSPDGKWIVFDDPQNNRLMKISITGGSARSICSLEGSVQGINWYEGRVLFGMNQAFYTVNPDGGKPVKIYPRDSIFESDIWNPQFLPDGETILFNQESVDGQTPTVRTVSLKSSDKPEILVEGAIDARYLKSGHIVYLKDASLQVVEFNEDSKKIVGTPSVLTSDQIATWSFHGQFDFNNHGTFAYWEGTTPPKTERHLVWIDFSGKIEKITREPGMLMSPSISGDGQHIATDLKKDGSFDIHLINPVLGTANHFITQNSTITPVWSPDDVTITYFQLEEPRGVYSKPVDLSYNPKLLFETKEITHLGNWSADGRFLLFRSESGIGYYDQTDESVKMLDFINTGEDEQVFYPQLSPDGKWLAYTSDDENNQDHVYVVPFPGPGRAHRISVYEGFASIWAPDMKAIYFIGLDDNGENVSKAEIQTSPQFSSSEPEILFYGNYTTRYQFENSRTYQFGNSGVFDIHPDGDRLLMQQFVSDEEDNSAEMDKALKLHVVVNWTELLKK